MSGYLLEDLLENDLENDFDKVLTAIIAETINCVYLHPVTFELVWLEINHNVIANIRERLYEKKSNKHFDLPDGLDWSTSLLWTNRVSVKSKQNGNPNNHQSCYSFHIPVYDFEWTFFDINGLTIKHLTEAAYRLKSSKYDYVNETIKHITTEEKNTDSIRFRITFDYGNSSYDG